MLNLLRSRRVLSVYDSAELYLKWSVQGLSISVNALAAAGDVLIAASLCFLLYRSRTGYRRYVDGCSRRAHLTYIFAYADRTP